MTDVAQDYCKNFFPATRDVFEARCGEVESVKESDFQDEYRRKHLESYQNSWNEWKNYPSKQKKVIDERVNLLVQQLISRKPESQKAFDVAYTAARKCFKIVPSKAQMLSVLQSHPEAKYLEQFLVKKVVRTHSGVVVITIMTSPGRFSCPKDCYYCPNEPGQPRSYLSTEPAVLRANQCNWDAAVQFWDRALTLYNNGHIIDKIEILVLGGTWSGYPQDYQEEFIRDVFYAANVFQDIVDLQLKGLVTFDRQDILIFSLPDSVRSRKTLEEEQILNEDNGCRIIGLTLETRPDYITPSELKRFRRFGCTRVQIGVQHTDDAILEKINRGCTLKDAIKAIKLLKDSCYKVDIHLMPDLPGSDPFKDAIMFEFVLSSPFLQVDQWKIYPCEVTPFSTIEKWYKEKTFIPYAEDNGQALLELIIRTKAAVHPWIRLNRVVRDIPNPSIIAGNGITNLRQILNVVVCDAEKLRRVEAQLKIRAFTTYGGLEYFLSYESPDEKQLFGFLRLRIRQDLYHSQVFDEFKITTSNRVIFPELEFAGLVRELHVYGQLVASQEKLKSNDMRSQHFGFGKKLLLAAEYIALSHKLNKMAIIAGVGTRNYYRKFGYENESNFMTKILCSTEIKRNLTLLNITVPLCAQSYSMKTQLNFQGELIPDADKMSLTEIVLAKGDLSPLGKSCCVNEFEIYAELPEEQSKFSMSITNPTNLKSLVALSAITVGVFSYFVYSRLKKQKNNQ